MRTLLIHSVTCAIDGSIVERRTIGEFRLDTAQLDIINHSDGCSEAFHCSSAVNGSCPIDSCPNGNHPNDIRGMINVILKISNVYLIPSIILKK